MELDAIIAKHLEDYHRGESRAEHGLTKALPKYIDTGQIALPLKGVIFLEKLHPLGRR